MHQSHAGSVSQRELRLNSGAVAVWVDLTALTASLLADEQRVPRLSDEEDLRAQRMNERNPNATSNDEWVAARVAMRLILEDAAGPAAAAKLRRRPFEIARGGKPSWPDSGLFFSLSHAAGAALIAVSANGDIGADIERARPLKMSPVWRSRIVTLAGALHGDDLQPHPPMESGSKGDFPIDDRTVLKAWVTIEAFGKASGAGVGGLLHAARKGLAADALAPYEAWRGAEVAIAERRAGDLVAAVARPRADRDLHVFRMIAGSDGGIGLSPARR